MINIASFSNKLSLSIIEMVSRHSRTLMITFFFFIFGIFIYGIVIYKNFNTASNEVDNKNKDNVLPNNNIRNITINKIQIQNKSVEKAQKCFATKFSELKDQSNYMWFVIDDIVTECAKGIRSNIPYIEATPDHYEHKYYMIPRIEFINDSCSVISFGIGGEIDSEKHIRMTFPQCTFLGIDPNEEYKHLFANTLMGKFVQAAAAGVTGKNIVYELGKTGYTETSAANKLVISAAEIIETYHGKDKLIDILNIDIEGLEYGILQRLFVDNVYKNACQINFEIHPVWYHFTGYTYHDAMEIFSKIAEDGTFLWVKNFIHFKQFYCGFFINVKNERCIEKYLKNRLF